MKDVLITSSALILALLILRQVFRKTISRRVQYALWGLVLLRLLVPVNLPAVEHNVLTTAEPVSRQIDAQALYIEPVREHVSAPAEVPVIERTPSEYQQVALDSATQDNTRVFTDQKNVTHTVEYARQISLNDLLRPIWYAGIAVMACWLVLSNLRFWRKLRKARTPYSVENCGYPVYLVESGLPSPCLFGLFRPAIYLTPAAVSSPESARHVLAHEETHARHWDPLWSLLRGVCLAVYWFDPLVWIAALVSRTDCELACDEGALKRLGQGERIAYGKTLLSLIPVAKHPANPVLTATTMTAGKRQLKDRITRIAEDRQTRAAALFAVIALAAVVCAATFTGAKDMGGEGASRPLTGAELTYFNEEFFNNDTVGGFVHTNIHNQFLTSLYQSPEDIDLYELFYCGTGSVGAEAEYGESDAMTEEERQLVCAFDLEGEEICPTDKLSVSAINSVLLANTGLTLEQTKRIGLENFTYLEQYDAYYHTHGDTNYFHSVQITAGTREGSTIRLYYPDSYAHYAEADWLCVTLEAQADGSYWFVSNLPSEKPVIPTVYPEGDPVLTIPLAELEPFAPQPVAVTPASNDCEQRGYGIMIRDDLTLRTYLSTDGNLYAAIIYNEAAGNGTMAEWEVGRFFTFPEGNSIEDGSLTVSIDSFHDLFGYSGAIVSYQGQIGKNEYNSIDDYYIFSDDGTPSLLARAYGTSKLLDLDGDGEYELTASAGGTAQLFFQRDGQLYEAKLDSLLEDAWPEAQYLSFNSWDSNGRCLTFTGEVPLPDSGMLGTATRYLYFNSSELLLYRDGSTYTDHISDSIDAPDSVLAAAREYVMSKYVQGVSCFDLSEDGDMVEVREDFDDWRIKRLVPYYLSAGELELEVWQLSYECHTSTKHHVLLAGGSYITEDGWCMIGYPYSDYLYFLLGENDTRTYLYSDMENDCFPGTELFFTDMVYRLMDMDLLSLTDLDGQSLLDMLSVQPTALLNRLAEEQTEAVQSAVIETLGNYIAAGDSYAAQNAYESCVNYMGVFDSDLSEAGRALWQRLQARIAEGPQAAEISAPPAVLAAAQEKAAAEFEAFRTQDWTADARYDGWRISYLAPVSVTAFGDASVTAAVYQMGCEYHAANPEAVALAGGMELTEDGWVGGLSAGYLVFSLDGGRYTLLDGEIAFDTFPDTPAFQAELASVLVKNGLAAPSDLDADTLLHMFYCGYSPYFLNLIGTYPTAERRAVIEALDSFHNRGGENERSLLRDAMQTAAWGIRHLDANGQAFWRELLDYTGITPGGIGGTYTNLDDAVHGALLEHRENASDHAYAFHAESHRVLDTVWTGNTCTVYLLFQFGDYESTGDSYRLSTGGTEAAALTFAAINGQYQLIEFWTPQGGTYYASDIRTCFPAGAAETAVNPGDELLNTLKTQLDAAAAETAARTFTKADVEFTGQALSAEADAMSYEERWAWCEAGGGVENGIGFAVNTAQIGDGYIAYAGSMTGVSPGASAWKYLYLRFPDGTLANLPLPKNNLIGTPLVDNGLFADGKFVYSVSFPEELVDGEILVHLKGTYRYEVDLDAKTVSLTVLDV